MAGRLPTSAAAAAEAAPPKNASKMSPKPAEGVAGAAAGHPPIPAEPNVS